jgi:hypothetical protein
MAFGKKGKATKGATALKSLSKKSGGKLAGGKLPTHFGARVVTRG